MKPIHPTSRIVSALVIGMFFVSALLGEAWASEVDMTGKWTMSVETPNGTGSPVFTLKQEGEALSGQYAGRFGEAPVKGSVKGNEFKITYELNGVEVTYAGKVEENACTGEVDYGAYGTGTFTGKK